MLERGDPGKTVNICSVIQLVPVLSDVSVTARLPGDSSCSCTLKGCTEHAVPEVLLELPLPP